MRKEIIVLILFFCFLLVSISLFSYDPSDPSINHVVNKGQVVHNLFGKVGSHIAGLCIGLFGVGAFWFPVLLLMAGIHYFMHRSAQVMFYIVIGGVLLIIATGGFTALYGDSCIIWGKKVSSGGIVGIPVKSFLLEYTNKIGSILVLILTFSIGFILVTRISILAFIARCWAYIIEFDKFLWKKIKLLWDKIKFKFKFDKNNYGKIGKLFQVTRYKIAKIFNRKKVEQLSENGMSLSDMAMSENRKLAENEILSDNIVSHGNKELSENEQLSGIEGQSESKLESETKISNSAVSDSQKTASANKELLPPNIKINPLLESTPSKKVSVRIMPAKDGFTLPSIEFLKTFEINTKLINYDNLRMKSGLLEDKLKDFGIKGEVVEISPGPVITTFEYRPAPGVKISKIVNLSDDLALALSAISIRIIAPIPGRDVIGIEIPNEIRTMVGFKDIIVSDQFRDSKSKLTICLGKDIVGFPVVAELDKMPHLLIAGATGTGKSVGLNAMIASLLYKATPDEVKFIMVDPKRIELSVYDGIPHLITPVVTDMKKATNALFWAVKEMERRYELLAQNKVRNITQYNQLVEKWIKNQKKSNNTLTNQLNNQPDSQSKNLLNNQENNQTGTHVNGINNEEDKEETFEKLPQIVIIIDELADLMMVASKDVELALTRLAQMARAAGLHIILATQRPSVDVLTGIIKANFPTRISFQVSSRIDSRTIIDSNGAENLLGNGDMLFVPPGTARLQRIHGAYISEDELGKIIDFLKEQSPPDYIADVIEVPEENKDDIVEEEHDVKYDEAVAFVTKSKQASISAVQRQFRIGYNRAARIIEMMEREGIVGQSDGTSRPREILVKGYGD